MTALWFGFGLLLIPAGVIFTDGAFLIAGAFSLGMAFLGALWRDHGRNKRASTDLAINSLQRGRVGYEDERKAA